MVESDKDRKKRLEAQRKAAKAKPENKAAVKKTAAPKKATKKAATPKSERPIGPSERPVTDVAPKTGEDWKKQGAEKNAAFEEVQKERDVNEIGGLDSESTVAEKQAREAKIAKYDAQVREIMPTSVPKNEVDATEDPLRPKMEEVVTPPTPSQAAARSSRTAPGGSGTGVYTFDAPRPAEMPRQDITKVVSRRSAKGLPGLPGDENGVNALALGLAKRDYAVAKETNKTVNEMDPEGDEPSHIDQIYYGHHRRLAEVMLRGGLSEDHVSKSAPGSGKNVVGKVKYLHSLLKAHDSARNAAPINIEKEGITHWIHPATGVAHAIADNHPDMPKTQPISVPGGEDVNHGFWRGGKEQRVRKDQNTGSWVIDKNTGNAEVDSRLGWNPDKEVGFTTVNLRGGIKALKQNIPPASGRSLWEHEVNNMKSEFPASVSGDSRLQHKAYANRILDDAAKSEVDGKVLARTRTGDPVPKVNRRTGKIQGIIRGTGRTVNRGFTVDENGEASTTTGISTSRARTSREGAPFPTKELGSSGYSEGGSIRVERTTDVPEMTKVVEFQSKKRRAKKSAIVEGRKVVVPPQRGLLLQKRSTAVLPSSQTSTPSQQFAAMTPPTAPSWDRPNVIGENESGVSTAEPITKGRGTVTKQAVPDPKVAKKNPKTKKTITKYDYAPGMVDQPLPGMEKIGVKEASDPFASKPTRKATVVEGPITSAQSFAENNAPYSPSSGESRSLIGRVSHVSSEKTPIADSPSNVSSQLANIAGNSTVEHPVSPGPEKTVRSYRKNKMVAPSPVAQAPAAPKEEPEQLSFPGMEPTDSAHSSGQQWLRTRELSGQTRSLQERSASAGVPGGSNPITVARGAETVKSNRSHK
ncbi:hypothetical protein UFOVP27_131 [uncultured Caudovirales phage]|uniref:Uncharacterized protein n=1 Tax=uncultured Caudovirales phage TaxID=2100421 RepID=A0A6J5KM54_9CAUD|nr:hypothetical protein UFOVP27_131 [uncultured Caudovirales phage]